MDFEEAFLDERDFSNCWDIVDGVCGTPRVVAVDFRTVGIAFHLMFLTYAFTVSVNSTLGDARRRLHNALCALSEFGRSIHTRRTHRNDWWAKFDLLLMYQCTMKRFICLRLLWRTNELQTHSIDLILPANSSGLPQNKNTELTRYSKPLIMQQTSSYYWSV